MFTHTMDPKMQRTVYIVTGGIIALMILFSFIIWRNTRTEPAAPAQESAQETVTEVRRQIDGARIATEKENRFPVAIMIENSSDAWPLSGVEKAQVVFETLAEGYIPRFMAIFAGDEDVPQIGPVRSARPYFIDWAEPYNAAYLHVGGSPAALTELRRSERVLNVDQFFKDEYFWRSQKRYAPHNVYTSSTLLEKLRVDMQLAAAEYPLYHYTDTEPTLDQRPKEVNDVVVNFTTQTYQARWKYDRDYNAYTRYQKDTLTTTENAGVIRAKNIVVMVTDMKVLDGVGRRDVRTTGEGKAWIFRDGTSYQVTWKRQTTKDLTRFFDETGSEIALNAGTTWFEVIPNAAMLVY